MLEYPLTLDATTPVTEAVENGVAEGVRGLNDVSRELQRAISIATTGGPPGAYVTQVSRLGISVLRAAVSVWSTAIDGLGLIAADQVEWWWTGELRLSSAGGGALSPGVARPSVVSVSPRRDVPTQWIRVAQRAASGAIRFIDHGAGTPSDWDGTCHVAVRQHEDFIPGAVVVTVTMLGATGQTLETSAPFDAVMSLA